MTIDKQDLPESVKAQRPRRAQEPTDRLRQLAVRSNALVGKPEWDTYLSFIEAMINDISEIRDHARTQLESGAVLKYEELIQVKIVFRESQAMLDALKYVIELPYSIIHGKSVLDGSEPKFPLPDVPEFVTKCK